MSTLVRSHTDAGTCRLGSGTRAKPKPDLLEHVGSLNVPGLRRRFCPGHSFCYDPKFNIHSVGNLFETLFFRPGYSEAVGPHKIYAHTLLKDVDLPVLIEKIGGNCGPHQTQVYDAFVCLKSGGELFTRDPVSAANLFFVRERVVDVCSAVDSKRWNMACYLPSRTVRIPAHSRIFLPRKLKKLLG